MKYSNGLFYYGKYYYIIYRAFNDKKFSFQFTYTFNKNDTIRFIFKYPLNSMKISRTNAYNIEIPRNIDETKSGMWTFMRFDPCYFIKTKLANNYKDFASLKDITYDTCILKSIEIFSTIHVRGIYISNFEFNTDNMSKEMQFRTLNNRPIVPIIFSDICEGQRGEEEPSMKVEPIVDNTKKIIQNSAKKKAKIDMKKYEIGDLDQNIHDIEKRREIMKKEAEQRKKDNIADIMKIKVAKETNKNN
jgi:hypothetical protein